MKFIVKSVVDIISFLVSLFFNFFYFEASRYFKNRIYTFAISRRCGSAGKGLSLDINSIVVHPEKIFIGKNFSALKNLRLDAVVKHSGNFYNPDIIIRDNVSVNTDCHIGCINRIEIGNNVLIASRVFITDHFHGDTGIDDIQIPRNKRVLYSKGPVVIKDNVWIGEGVTILPNVTIGENAIIGANAVVSRDIPDYAIAAGNPARVIRIIK